MHIFSPSYLRALAILATALAALIAAPALAHEHREVGPHEFVVGWSTEPAIEGQKNGVSLRVTEHGTMKPVEGLQDTLEVEVTHVPTNTRKVFKLRTVFNKPGSYANDILVTAPGDYRFRFFGTIGAAAIDETFQSTDEKFDAVSPSADLQWPIALASGREVQAAVRGAEGSASQAQASAESARTQAGSAMTLGAVAAGLSIAALLLGGGALMATMRKR